MCEHRPKYKKLAIFVKSLRNLCILIIMKPFFKIKIWTYFSKLLLGLLMDQHEILQYTIIKLTKKIVISNKIV